MFVIKYLFKKPGKLIEFDKKGAPAANPHTNRAIKCENFHVSNIFHFYFFLGNCVLNYSLKSMTVQRNIGGSVRDYGLGLLPGPTRQLQVQIEICCQPQYQHHWAA